MQKFEWITSTLKVNWSNMTANKTAFFAMSFFMALQNLIYFMLWGALFSRISSLRGWGLSEVAFLYGSGALGFGLVVFIFGGMYNLSENIQNGTLDIYLARPRNTLLSAILHNMHASALGDIVSGIIMLAFIVHPPLSSIPLLAVLSLTSALVYGAFLIAVHSLSFWNISEKTTENSFIAFIIASTLPQNGFNMVGKLALLTIFPAGYIALLPVQIIKHFSWQLFAMQVLGSIVIFALSLFIFKTGLKRYTSGNSFLVLR